MLLGGDLQRPPRPRPPLVAAAPATACTLYTLHSTPRMNGGVIGPYNLHSTPRMDWGVLGLTCRRLCGRPPPARTERRRDSLHCGVARVRPEARLVRPNPFDHTNKCKHIYLYLSFFLSIYPSICLSIYIYIHFYLSIYLSPSAAATACTAASRACAQKHA